MHTAPDTLSTDAATPAPIPRGISERIDHLFRKLFFLIPIGVIGNILLCFVASDRDIFASITSFSSVYLGLAMLLSIVPWFTSSFRLLIWSRFLGNNIDFPAVFKIVIGAELGAAVSPPLIGGSAVKIGMLMRHGFTGGTALSLSVLENIEDTIFFLVMVPLALTISSSWDLPQVGNILAGLRNQPPWMLLIGIGVCLGATFLLMKIKSGNTKPWLSGLAQLKEKVLIVYRNFIATYHRIAREGKSIFVVTMALTSLQWLCRYSIISLLLASLGLPVRPILFMVLQVFVFALTTLVPTPGATGGAEVMFSLMYRSFLPVGTIGFVTAGWRFLTFYFLLLLAAVLSLLLKIQSGAESHPANKQGVVSQRVLRTSKKIVLKEE